MQGARKLIWFGSHTTRSLAKIRRDWILSVTAAKISSPSNSPTTQYHRCTLFAGTSQTGSRCKRPHAACQVQKKYQGTTADHIWEAGFLGPTKHVGRTSHTMRFCGPRRRTGKAEALSRTNWESGKKLSDGSPHPLLKQLLATCTPKQ